MDKIILLEDDSVLQKELTALLEDVYHVEAFCCIRDFIRTFPHKDARLYILDVMLPDGNGFDLCKEIRKSSQIPILLLSALDGEQDVIAGLEAGGDDYITKPFSGNILKARIRALLRRTLGNDGADLLYCGDLEVDFSGCKVKKDGADLGLLAKEFQIIALLIQSRGSLVSRRKLLDRIWDLDGNFIDDNTISVHMSRIRKKLGTYQDRSYLITERGFGYRWGVKIEKQRDFI